jgi:hypothetical protein
MKTWFLPVPGTELQYTSQFERGSYFVFDVASWQRARKDNVVLPAEMLLDATQRS